MPDDLYSRDILAWSIAQAECLRRVAAGERVSDLDWANVIEEVGVGGAERNQAVVSLLRQALVHALKVIAWPDHRASRQWRNEIGNFLDEARDRYTPSMAQQIDLEALLRKARARTLSLAMDAPPVALAETTNVTLAELLDESLGADALIARLRPA